jgi:hypothetical protein
VCDVSCQHLSCLTSLQEFHISKYAAISHTALSDIGTLQQLTRLQIQCASWHTDLHRILGFADMTGLRHLEVYDSKELNPEILAAMTNLEHLAIVKTGLNPSGVSAQEAMGVPMLLSILPEMQQLTCLHLVNCLNWPQPLQAYAALTASPKLARLILRCGGCSSGYPCGQNVAQQDRSCFVCCMCTSNHKDLTTFPAVVATFPTCRLPLPTARSHVGAATSLVACPSMLLRRGGCCRS